MMHSCTSSHSKKKCLQLSLKYSVCLSQSHSLPYPIKGNSYPCTYPFLFSFIAFIPKQYIETLCKWKLYKRVSMCVFFCYLLFIFQLNILEFHLCLCGTISIFLIHSTVLGILVVILLLYKELP